jgi:ABC-type multidrug transport system permease subunit
MDLPRLVFKNFKLLIRNKTSIFTLILAPVIIIFLLGLAFNTTNVYNIIVTVYSSQYTPLSEELLGKLAEKDFAVVRTTSSKECIEMIKAGESNICLELPPDLSIEKDKTNNIIFHVDPSQINLVWLVLDIISDEISSKTEEISLDLTNIIINRLKATQEALTEKSAVMQELIDENSKILDYNAVINKELSKLDLSFDGNDFNISKLEKMNNENSNDLVEIYSYISDKVDSSKKLVVDGIKIVGNDSTAGTKFNKIDTDLSNIQTKTNKIMTMNETNIKRMTSLISTIGLGLEDIDYRLSEASYSRDLSVNKSRENAIMLSNHQKDLEEMKNTIDGIVSGIEGVQISEAGQIVNPITTTIKPVVEERTHLNYIFAGIVILIVMFVSILLASNIVVMEKKSKSFLINYLAPTKDVTFVLSIYITAILLMMIQLLIIMVISAYFFKSLVLSRLGTISLILFISTSLFVLFGMLIAYVFKAEQTITLVTISFGSLLLFLSDIILPIQSMPLFFQKIVQYNPFLVSEQLLKKVILFGVNFTSLIPDILYLLGLSVVVFIIILLNEQLIKRHSLAKMFKGI